MWQTVEKRAEDESEYLKRFCNDGEALEQLKLVVEHFQLSLLAISPSCVLEKLDEREKAKLEAFRKYRRRLLNDLTTSYLYVSDRPEAQILIADYLAMNSGLGFIEVSPLITYLLPLSRHVEVILTEGCDERTVIRWGGDRLNKYNTTTDPVGEGADYIARGSCTASTPSTESLAHVDSIRKSLLREAFKGESSVHEKYFLLINSVKQRITRALKLDDHWSDRLWLTPSGTDAELIGVVAGLARSLRISTETLYKWKVVSVITAAGEVGSATPLSAGGKHLAASSPSGRPVAKSAYVKGLEDIVDIRQVNARAKDGNRLSEDDQELLIRSTVRDALCDPSNGAHVVVLHVVHCSKTGLSIPTLDCALNLRKEFGNRLVIFIDAAQLRMAPLVLKSYLEENCIVMFTGSKFYAGPPFCGGVYIPQSFCDDIELLANSWNQNKNHLRRGIVAEEFLKEISHSTENPEDRFASQQKHEQPDGSKFELTISDVQVQIPSDLSSALSDYYSCYTVPKETKLLRQAFPPRMNMGLLFRWEACLLNMEEYAEIPYSFVAKTVGEWIDGIKRIILENELLEIIDGGDNNPIQVGGRNTIISVAIRDIASSWYIKQEPLQEIHHKLACGSHPIVHTGQPVLISEGLSALRLCLSAPMVIAVYRHCKGDESLIHSGVCEVLLRNDEEMIKKIASIIS